MQSTLFAVNDEPYCLWEEDLNGRTRTFLNGIDPEYFDYVLQAHTSTEDEKRALVAIRLSLHHSIETLFSLLGAYVQAPDCPYAWIAKCSTVELREFAQRVQKSDGSLITKLNISSVTWNAIAGAIFESFQPGTERQKATVDCFATLWAALAEELLDSSHIDEYNAMKHGFRARPGGFGLAVGIEPSPGVSPPDSEMKTLGHSDFGATFFKIQGIGASRGGRHIRSRQTSVNWSLERSVLLHQLVYMSITNVVAALKIVNGIAPSLCRFLRPESDTDFEKPWTFGPGVTSMAFDYVIDETRLPTITKADLLTRLKRREA